MTDTEIPTLPRVKQVFHEETDRGVLVFVHQCLDDDAPSEAVIRIGRRGWHIDQREPLTLSPSIRCPRCGTHGYWQHGTWHPIPT